jgi:hypothetical protein
MLHVLASLPRNASNLDKENQLLARVDEVIDWACSAPAIIPPKLDHI